MTTGAQGIQDVAEAGVKFVKDSVTDTVNAITGIPGSLGQSTTQVSKLSTQKAVTESNAPAVSELAEDTKAAVENVDESTTSKIETAIDPVKTAESVKAKITTARTTNGATKLTDGNKAEPGKPAAAVRDRISRAADDVRSGIESSAQQARETVKKLTGADKPTKADKSDNSTAKPKTKDAA